MAEVDLAPLASLEYLDLSRNLIAEIMPGTFMGMTQLKGLDFSVNVVRKVSRTHHSNTVVLTVNVRLTSTLNISP